MSNFLICCFKQKTAYEMRISDWSSDVCSSDLSQPAILSEKIGFAFRQVIPIIVPVESTHQLADLEQADAFVPAISLRIRRVAAPCRVDDYEIEMPELSCGFDIIGNAERVTLTDEEP